MRAVIKPYKRRTIHRDEDVWVYRNLMRTDGVWYSVMQRSLVVAHATDVALVDCRFVVREGGRQRVVATGVKNVHAYVVGRLLTVERVFSLPPFDDYVVGRYSPLRAATFQYAGPLPETWLELGVAEHARLYERGLAVSGASATPVSARHGSDGVTARQSTAGTAARESQVQRA